MQYKFKFLLPSCGALNTRCLCVLLEAAVPVLCSNKRGTIEFDAIAVYYCLRCGD